jgi:hypothetical protein
MNCRMSSWCILKPWSRSRWKRAIQKPTYDYRNPTSTWGAYTCVPPQKNPTGLGHAAVLRCSNCPTSTTAWFKRVPHASADAVKAPTCAQRRKFKEGTNRGNVSSCA